MQNNTQHSSSTASVLNQTAVSDRFCQYFSYGWNFIEADNIPNASPDWRTENRYPLDPLPLLMKWSNPQVFVGVRFGKKTCYGMLDVDRGSPYHPDNNATAFRKLRGRLEDMGFPCVVFIQSSHSEGLHLYLPLPYPVPTYDLACYLYYGLKNVGFQIQDGCLETFPHKKRYDPNQITNYKAHRLPLQPNSGSYLLDDDLNPISIDISTFLNHLDFAAKKVDTEEIERGLLCARELDARTRKGSQNSNLRQWKTDLEQRFAIGFTDYQQTNDLMGKVACYHRVFDGLSGQNLSTAVAQTTQNLPGYQAHCRHQHEIERRAREWAKSAERYYFPYGKIPNREGQYRDFINNAIQGISSNLARACETAQRIRKAAQELLHRFKNNLPKTVQDWQQALLNILSELFPNYRPSTKSLTKYRHLWHPKNLGFTHHLQANPNLFQKAPQAPPETPEPAENQESTPPQSSCPTPKTPEPAENQEHTPPPLYEGIVGGFSSPPHQGGEPVPPVCAFGFLSEGFVDPEIPVCSSLASLSFSVATDPQIETFRTQSLNVSPPNSSSMISATGLVLSQFSEFRSSSVCSDFPSQDFSIDLLDSMFFFSANTLTDNSYLWDKIPTHALKNDKSNLSFEGSTSSVEEALEEEMLPDATRPLDSVSKSYPPIPDLIDRMVICLSFCETWEVVEAEMEAFCADFPAVMRYHDQPADWESFHAQVWQSLPPNQAQRLEALLLERISSNVGG